MVLAILVATASPAFAQTTGSLQGTVFDEDGLEVPTVTVTLSGESLIGGSQSITTNSRGYYRFVELLPGVYTVTAVKEGFRTVTVEGIQVNINRSTTQNLTMRLGGEAEEVIVTGQQVVDTESTTVGQVLTKDFLQRIPTGRSYQNAVSTATGVTDGSGGNPNMGGSATNENTYMLDGATITDPVTGTFSLNFNYDAIQQIEVLLGGYEPEYGISLGGIVNLVTESGTNNLEFDTSVFYTNGNWFPKKDSRFTADGFSLGPSGFDSQFQTLQIAGKVSGPIVRDKAWFIISYQHDRSLIATTGTPQRRDYDGHYILSKLTVQPTSEHRISLLLQTNPSTIDNIYQGNPFVKDEAQGRQAQGGFVSQLRWQWFLTPKTNLDTRVMVQKIYIEQGAVPCTHNTQRDQHPCRPGEEENYVDWLTPGRVGQFGAFDSVNWGSIYLDDRWTVNANTKLSVLGIEDPMGGSHDFKFGLETRQFINDYINGYSGNKQYSDLNESQFDPTTLSNYYWLEVSGAFRARQSGSTWNFFIQDSYKPVSNLTIKYGTRFDSTVLRNDFGEPTIRGNLFGPRLYAAWDPWGDQKTKIAGGWGRFNDSGRQSVASFTNVNTLSSKLWLGEYFDGRSSIDNTYVPSGANVYSVGPRENTSSAYDNLRLPSLDEFILMVQRQVIEDLAVGADFSARFTRHLYEPDETNLIYDEDGSQIIGSRTGDPTINYLRLRTPRQARRNYYRLTAYLAKVQSRRWAANASYSFVFMNGTSTGSLSGAFTNDPQTRYNYGPIPTSEQHQVKAQGYWRLPTDPWTQTLGFYLQYISGPPLERYYWSEAYNSYGIRIRDRSFYTRYPANWFFNIKFQQEFDVRKGKLVADIELRNLLNNRAAYSVSSFLSQENRLFIFGRQDPLRVQLGLRYEF